MDNTIIASTSLPDGIPACSNDPFILQPNSNGVIRKLNTQLQVDVQPGMHNITIKYASNEGKTLFSAFLEVSLSFEEESATQDELLFGKPWASSTSGLLTEAGGWSVTILGADGSPKQRAIPISFANADIQTYYFQPLTKPFNSKSTTSPSTQPSLAPTGLPSGEPSTAPSYYV